MYTENFAKFRHTIFEILRYASVETDIYTHRSQYFPPLGPGNYKDPPLSRFDRTAACEKQTDGQIGL